MYFNIRCKGRCYTCNNPLEPYVKSNNWQVRDLVRHYRKTISPLYCYNNETFYKIYKLKAQRLCYSCFKHDRQKITPQQLRKRECGQYNYFNRVPSLSDKDLISWFQRLCKYINKSYVKDRPVPLFYRECI